MRLPITANTREWSPELDAALPINTDDIPGFVAWVNCNGFLLDRNTGRGHDGFDFGAYLRDDDKVVVGLPKETPVRAVADGVVRQVLIGGMTGGGYGCMVNIEHGGDDSGMFSSYIHIDPSIEPEAEVAKGEVLGSLYKDSGNRIGRLVHLHMRLVDGWGTHGTGEFGGGLIDRTQDVGLIDPSIYDLTVSKQGFEPFDCSEVPSARGIEVANFDTLQVNNFVWAAAEATNS